MTPNSNNNNSNFFNSFDSGGLTPYGGGASQNFFGTGVNQDNGYGQGTVGGFDLSSMFGGQDSNDMFAGMATRKRPGHSGGGDQGNTGFFGDKMANGIGIGANILGAIMTMKQLGMAKDVFKHQQGMDLANLGNQAKLAQSNLDLQQQRRAVEGGGYFDNINNPQLQQGLT